MVKAKRYIFNSCQRPSIVRWRPFFIEAQKWAPSPELARELPLPACARRWYQLPCCSMRRLMRSANNVQITPDKR